jgi:hypothetical protein
MATPLSRSSPVRRRPRTIIGNLRLVPKSAPWKSASNGDGRLETASPPAASASTANGMKIAAIDIGSNSIHMVTAQVRQGDFEILDRAKEMVGLARGTLTSGRLSDETLEFGLKTLGTFKRLAERQGADPILAVATSAVREAVNGGEFVLQAWEKFGLHIDVITGAQEARLIFAAARHAIDFRGQRPLVVDIGGGSIEIVQGEGNKIRWQKSLKLGVVRLTERFFKSDPPKAGEIAAFKAYVREKLEPVFAHARHMRPTMLVGTSGTLLTLTAMAAAIRDGAPPHKLHNYILERKALADLTTKILESRGRERAHIPGLERRRVDLIPAGALLAGIVLDGFRCEKAYCSTSSTITIAMCARPSMFPASGAAAFSAWPAVFRPRRVTATRWRAWRSICSTPPNPSTSWVPKRASCWNTPPCCTMWVYTSAIRAIIAIPIT